MPMIDVISIGDESPYRLQVEFYNWVGNTGYVGIRRGQLSQTIWVKPSERAELIRVLKLGMPRETIDIDHPAVIAGAEALLGHHPERGGQERLQAVFAVLMAAIPLLINEVEETNE